ncbi:MAG: adenylosuccinate synthase [Dehalococcoidia bacterium]|nr:adenylosuccinate synthase [Dehalococcoidia bacterium]
MPVLALVGGQWGDEGKGKVVDQLAESADVVVRFSGGDNAGHTVINHLGEFKLHLVPAGIFTSRVLCIIGNGVVINPAVLMSEIEMLNKAGVDTSHLVISNRAHLVMPYHLLLDELEEKSRAGKALGTTKRGIGPAFADKTNRLGIRTCDLLDKDGLKERLTMVMDSKNTLFTKVYDAPPMSLDKIYDEYCVYADFLASYIKDTSVLLTQALARKQLVIMEGAQGALLDPDFGTYPYGTSSSPLSAGGSLGAGIAPNRIDKVLGIFKAYCTRVGNGPMPTELFDATGDEIRNIAHEFGTTTGRPRRIGWFDAVAARFSCFINGLTSVALTRLDVLDSIPSVKICTAYELNGELIDYFPASVADLEKCRPVYEELSGWNSPISHVRKFTDLPLEAQRYVRRIEELMGCEVGMTCCGPSREQVIHLKSVI